MPQSISCSFPTSTLPFLYSAFHFLPAPFPSAAKNHKNHSFLSLGAVAAGAFLNDGGGSMLYRWCPPKPLRTRPVCVVDGGHTMLQDAGATLLVLGGAYSLVGTFDSLTKHDLVEQKLSRKIVHILSGLLFMSSWPLFSPSKEARFFAATVPLLNMLRLLIYGLSLLKDEGLIKSVTREGKPEELLRGPLYYVLVLLFSVIVFWRDSPVGLIALAMMSAGDGIADIMGRKFGSLKLPYNKHKSWIGSISMFSFGFIMSLGMLYFYSSLGFIVVDSEQVVRQAALVSLAATVVESLPFGHVLDDNISVPLSSMLVALLVFGQ